MMKSFFALLFLFISILSYAQEPDRTFVDLGVHGFLFDIEEENGDDLIKRKIKDFNVTALTNDYRRQVEEAYHSEVVIKRSFIDSVSEREDKKIARWDIKTPDGEILVYKGEVIPQRYLSSQPFSLCFIDAGLQDKVVKEVVDIFSTNCIYMIDNADVRKFSEKYKVESYPIGGQNLSYLKFFKVEMLPTKITKSGSKIITQTLNIKKIILEKTEQ